MKYQNMTIHHAEIVEKLFMEALKTDGLSLKPFGDRESFLDFFLPEREENYCKVTILSVEENAFASGCYVREEERAYITFLTVAGDARRRGVGRNILRELEKILSKMGAKRLEIVFFNPMAFSWIIPGTEGADHPNAPGIDVSTGAYFFFQNCGYFAYAIQNSYYLNLSDYAIPKELNLLEQNLAKRGIEIDIYDKNKHYGLEKLMQRFGNSMWQKAILGEVEKGEDSRQILIVKYECKVVGFTGPLDVEESGRGFFAGIGVDSAYRGQGIAKVLFGKLCSGLKGRGARFMTLFTGETNPARNIYEAAGFCIVKTWADMRKG